MPDVSLNGIDFEIKGNAEKASASIDDLVAKLDKLSTAIESVVNKSGLTGVGNKAKKEVEPLDEALQDLIRNADKVEVLRGKLDGLRDSLEDAFEAGNEKRAWGIQGQILSTEAALEKATVSVKPLSAEMQDMIANASQIDILEAKLESLRSSMQQAFDVGDQEGAYKFREQILRTEAALEKARAAADKTADSLEDVGDSAKKANKPLGNFLNSLKRIAMYRVLRSIIKSITQAFQEGLKNAYEFSKATGDQSGLAASLDKIASSSLQMKNQLGAAFGGLLTAITPIAVQIIGVVTRIAEAISRLLAILGGQGKYLKAKEFWTEWGDAAEGAGGAAKKALEYLAPFDELNVLPDPKSGGGGGGDSTNWGDMFEYAETGGESFLEGLTSLFQDISDWFQSKDWQDIGGKAWETLKEVFTDGTAAHEAVAAFMEALGSAFGAVFGAAWGFIHDLVEDLAIQFKRNLIDYNGDGKITAVDFLKAVLKTGGDIAGWVYDTLVKPFFDGFGRALTGDSSFDFTNWAKENFLNPIIRAWNTFTQNMLNPFIEAINRAIDYINDQFNTNIPHIPLIGEVAELEIKVPSKDRKIPNGMMTVKEFEDSVPAKNKTIDGVTANTTNVKDSISKDKKWFQYFGADISSLNDKVDKRYKKIDSVQAVINKVDTAKLTAEQKRITTTANMKYVRTGELTTEQKRIGTTANMKYVRTTDLTNEQRRIRTTANMQNVRTNDLKDEARRIRTTANLQGAVNNIPKSQLSLASTAEVKAKVIKPSLQDPYTGNLQLEATAHISRVTGQTSIDMYTKNAANGAASANGIVQAVFSPLYSGGIPSSVASSDNDGGMTENLLYRAFSRALADSDLGGDIELDGNTLYKAMVNRNRANTRLTGVNAMA